jgi:hypothetical protein
VRDQLYQLYLGRPFSGKLNLTLTSELPGNVVSLSLDPQNVTMEAEHFAEVDRERFARRKPLLWFWQMFDRSPVGLNHWLGLRFRCMLGRHIFEHLGTGVKIYHGVDLTYGYNLSIGDGVTIRQRALLNDRGGITIGNNAVIGSFRASFRSGTIRRTTTRSGCSPRSSARRPHRHPRHRPRRTKRRPRRSRRHLPRRSRLKPGTCRVLTAADWSANQSCPSFSDGAPRSLGSTRPELLLRDQYGFQCLQDGMPQSRMRSQWMGSIHRPHPSTGAIG